MLSKEGIPEATGLLFFCYTITTTFAGGDGSWEVILATGDDFSTLEYFLKSMAY